MSAIAPTAVSQTAPLPAPSKAALWTGRTLSTLVVLFLLFDSVMKFLKPAPVVQGFAQFGISMDLCVPIGLILLLCTLLYAIPPTSVLGAILLTGYLGGAVFANLRISMPLFSFLLAPVYVGVLLWLGLYLRDPRLRALVPFRS
jgi:hypothetical protein